MNGAAPAVRRASDRDLHAVTLTIAQAFQDLDVTGWLVPDPEERRRVLYANFTIHVHHALEHAQVHITDDRTGVAVWYIRDGIGLPPAITDYDRRLALACGPHADRFRTLDDAFEQHHPDAPHHYLAFLAVRPAHQGQGIGTALLNQHHRVIDGVGLAAYLEATSPASRALYLRLGYRDHGDPIVLPDGNARLWPMWREPTEPRQASSTAGQASGRPAIGWPGRTDPGG